MQFFMPHTGKAEAESAHKEIKNLLISQFRLPILDRRIYNVSYTNSKKNWYAEVGQLEEQENLYEILAIFESKQYIVYTRSKRGGPGPIILIDKTEVTAVEDFDGQG